MRDTRAVRMSGVAVVGQGVIGLAATLALARRGTRVIAVDALGSGHPLTSSTGASRSIRTAYATPAYVRLALEAISSWHALEAETGRTILQLTGHIDLGPADLLDSLEESMVGEGVRARRVDAADTGSLFPELRLAPGERGLYHESGGTVLASEAMAALASAAIARGAELASPERVERIQMLDDGVRLSTTKRVLDAQAVVVAAGPWTGELLSALGVDLPLTPAVAQVTYFAIPSFVDRPGIADWSVEPIGRGVYGHPVPGVGYKFAFDAAGDEPWTGSAVGWAPDVAEQDALVEWVSRRFPGTPARVVQNQRHPWTMTPDTHFVIDAEGPLVVACGCSGHAFKFGPALGELVADVALGIPSEERAMFSMRRSAMSLGAVDRSTPIDR